ncbi:MAG: thioredoxin fold domain-containing protein [Sulfuriferula sp.]
MKKALIYLSICLGLCANVVWAAPKTIAYASDLHQDGLIAAQKHVPILIIFTSPDCHYCEKVMNSFLIPMQRNPEYARKVIMRRVEINSSSKLIGFDSAPTTQRAYAATQKIRLTPTVVIYTPSGTPAAEPLVGLGPEEYYGSYLDSAIATGLEKSRQITR